MANPLADAALEGLKIGREEGERTARVDKLEATREWVNNWRRNNGVGPNVTPSKDVVPFKWMHPFLHKVEGPEGDLMIAGDPSFKIGGGKSGSRKNKAIMKNADVGTPNAKEFMDKYDLGPSMFPVNKAQVTPGPAPTWPMHKWPYPTPGQGPLPNPNIPDKAGLSIASLDPAILNALKAGTQKGLSSRQIRDLLKPYTKPDQFGHPTGSFRGV